MNDFVSTQREAAHTALANTRKPRLNSYLTQKPSLNNLQTQNGGDEIDPSLELLNRVQMF